MIATGTMWDIDDAQGAIRIEGVYETDVDDLWQACTDPERLARWIVQVAGTSASGAS
jgi:uncharacterized protein YndB with AHSA1/START domain